MKSLSCKPFLLCAAASVAISAESVSISRIENQTAVDVTIYNDDMALIRDTR